MQRTDWGPVYIELAAGTSRSQTFMTRRAGRVNSALGKKEELSWLCKWVELAYVCRVPEYACRNSASELTPTLLHSSSTATLNTSTAASSGAVSSL